MTTENNSKIIWWIVKDLEKLTELAEHLKGYQDSYDRLSVRITESVTEKVTKILILRMAKGTMNHWLALISVKMRNIHSDVNSLLETGYRAV